MTTPPPLIAVEDLFGAPTRSRALLSPDGRGVTYLAPWRGRLADRRMVLPAPDASRCPALPAGAPALFGAYKFVPARTVP